MPQYLTEAVCLKASDYSESDRILTLFSPAYGRIRAIAKGVKKPKSKLAGVCELFHHVQVQLAHGRTLEVVCQYHSINPYAGLRSDLGKVAFAALFCDLIIRLTEDRDPSDSAPMFHMLLHGLENLEHAETCEQQVAFATQTQLQLLHVSGCAPQLDHCIVCSEALSLQDAPYYAFHPDLGGLLCPACTGHYPPSARVNIATETLCFLLDPTGKRTSEETHLKSQRFLNYYVSHHLDHAVTSYAFVLETLSP